MMATEGTGAPERAEEQPRRCVMKDADQRCWREATERLIVHDLEPDVCAEHLYAFRKAREMDALLDTLEQMGEWIAGATSGNVETPLNEYAFKMIGQAYRDYWRAAVRYRAANLIAIQGPEEEPLTLEQAERIAELLERSSELDKVWNVLERAPQEALGTKSRWPLIAALYAAQGAVSEELDRTKREIGRKA